MLVSCRNVSITVMWYTLSLLLWNFLSVVQSYSSGAPTSTCKTMKPGHGYNVQTEQSPFKIIASQPCYKYRDRITVKIETTGSSFKGLFVQARSGSDESNSYGTFSTSDSGMKINSCWGVMNNAITHSNSRQKNGVTFQWQPKRGNTLPIKFVATVVQQYTTYWVGLTSDPVLYDANCLETTSSTTSTPIMTTTTPIMTTTTPIMTTTTPIMTTTTTGLMTSTTAPIATTTPIMPTTTTPITTTSIAPSVTTSERAADSKKKSSRLLIILIASINDDNLHDLLKCY